MCAVGKPFFIFIFFFLYIHVWICYYTSMKASKNLSDWLSIEMNSRGITYAQLDKATGISATTWSRILRREISDISTPTEDALCKFFHISKLDLFHIIYDPDDAQRLVGEDNPNEYKIDNIGQLAAWLRKNPQHQPLFISMAVSLNCPFENNEPGD